MLKHILPAILKQKNIPQTICTNILIFKFVLQFIKILDLNGGKDNVKEISKRRQKMFYDNLISRNKNKTKTIPFP